MEEDADGNVVAYRDITNVAYDDDPDADAAEEEAGEPKKKKKKKKKRGLFGFGRGGGDDDDVEKDDPFVRNRLMSVLDKDRGGWRAPVVRMEFNSACVYEGEMGRREARGRGEAGVPRRGLVRRAMARWRARRTRAAAVRQRRDVRGDVARRRAVRAGGVGSHGARRRARGRAVE